jgi:hypothetical protein
MAACVHCGGCCPHCGAICHSCSGAPAHSIGGAFGGGNLFGGIGYMPFVSGVAFHHHKKRDDAEEAPKVDCDALADPDHPDHREAVTTIAHVDDGTHESMLRRIKEELEKLEPGR